MVYIKDPHRINMAAKNNNKKIRIFLDLDGVVTNWVKGATEALHLRIDDPKVRSQIKKGKRIEDFVGGTDNMWRMIENYGEDWWVDLETFPWSMKLFEELRRRAGLFSILTSPSRNPICASGKMKWMKKHFGEDFKDFLIGSVKHLCACPNSLLINDDRNNVLKFRQHGGYAFRWPDPLEIQDGDIEIEDVFSELFNYIDEIERKLK